jgi:peroxisomal 3,2-trans-enoyl-CoA isomerase
MSHLPGPITVEYEGKVAIITIDDQKKLNALSQDNYYKLACLLREVAARDDIFVTVLTAKGMSISLS